MKTVRNVENEVRRKLMEIDDLILDWMEDMDMPDGTAISSEVHDARRNYEDTISQFMTGLLKAVDDGMYCMECGALLTENHTVWNLNHECYCTRCATMKMIPF